MALKSVSRPGACEKAAGGSHVVLLYFRFSLGEYCRSPKSGPRSLRFDKPKGLFVNINGMLLAWYGKRLAQTKGIEIVGSVLLTLLVAFRT